MKVTKKILAMFSLFILMAVPVSSFASSDMGEAVRNTGHSDPIAPVLLGLIIIFGLFPIFWLPDGYIITGHDSGLPF